MPAAECGGHWYEDALHAARNPITHRGVRIPRRLLVELLAKRTLSKPSSLLEERADLVTNCADDRMIDGRGCNRARKGSHDAAIGPPSATLLLALPLLKSFLFQMIV